ncbi:MAG TPA: hypothetical protein VK306_10830 [Acidimicrobiales bacterium]|nr:hypothetical protein [Acidimicrobiales bacterium]
MPSAADAHARVAAGPVVPPAADAPGAQRSDPVVDRRRVAIACALVGVAVAAWAAIAIPARATYRERTTADEPQYLLSALSLAEDGDLWIDDEIAGRRFRPFHDEALPTQTEPLANGRSVSPHDPLLPVVLAVPMGIGGWVGAKAALAALGGALAALLTWVAHRRLGVPLGVAAGTTLTFGAAAPLSAYATQVYPELPAALAVAAALAVLLQTPPAAPTAAGSATAGPPPAAAPTGAGSAAAGLLPLPWGRGAVAVLVVAVAALPWLGIKYAPVAAVLAALGVARLVRAGRVRTALGVAAALAAIGAAYLVVHRLVYGGWTVYAAGDHFTGGELTVAGEHPDRVGRTRRLAGLLLDEGFGLVVWMPGFLLAVPALAALARRSWRTAVVLVAPLAAGWATATWVALTMHGWWWPGRQVVVVVPCLVLAVAWWAGRVAAVRPAVVVAGVVGAGTWLWLVVEVLAGRVTLIGDFERTANPVVRLLRLALPDYRHPGVADWVLQGLWLAGLGVAALLAARVPRPVPVAQPRIRDTEPQPNR